MKDGSTTGHAEIKEECRMKKNEENDPNFYYFYFNIEHWYDFNRHRPINIRSEISRASTQLSQLASKKRLFDIDRV